jgi:hypothetical protein
LYVSPFIGYGKLALGKGDEPLIGEDYTYHMIEKELGIILGYQPFGSSRFTVDLFVGPEYQWRTKQRTSNTGDVRNDAMNRFWLRGGYNLSFRIVRVKP